MGGVGAFLTTLMSWFAGVFLRLGSWMTLHYVATKVIMGILFIVVLPVIVNNVLLDLFSQIFYWWLAQTPFGQGLPGELAEMPKVFQFAGVGGYIAAKMGIPDALIIVLNASAYRLAMTWIPFVGPR